MLPEVGITGLIVLPVATRLLVGPKRLPEIGRSLGKGMREFKDSISNSSSDDKAELPPSGDEPPPSSSSSSS
jgi:sec-independent protein translocase protein TatA